MTRPSKEDLKKVREQVDTAIDQIRTPLLAALGAGNLASQAVVDAVNKAKDVDGLRDSAKKSFDDAKARFDELPRDVDGVREKLDPAELRKVVEDYTEAARKLYEKLTESGEEALDQLLAQPQIKKALEQLQEALENAQDRIEDATTDVRDRVEDILGKVTKRTKETGSKAAKAAKTAKTEIGRAHV